MGLFSLMSLPASATPLADVKVQAAGRSAVAASNRPTVRPRTRRWRLPQAARPSLLGYLLCLLLLGAGAGPGHALTIIRTDDPSVAANLNAADKAAADSAFDYAASQFTTRYSDPITVNITMKCVAGTTTLGQSDTSLAGLSYSQLRSALMSGAKSSDDASAVATLPASDPTNAKTWFVSRAEAKALGLQANDTTEDGAFTFGAGFVYTYDPNNRAVANEMDFIGVAMHEISEIMGRISGLGANFGDGGPDYMLYDLFRYTGSGTRGLTNGGGVFFSINGGGTDLKDFNDQATLTGDASDWASGTNDSFNAFSGPGVLDALSAVDVQVMDVLGYSLPSLPPTVTSFSPASGPIGTSVIITGSNFTGATAVTFNGTSASFTVNSASQITATVPSNATTGVINVAGPGGNASSATNFIVIPSIAINSVSVAEGNTGTTNATFTVALTAPSTAPITVDYGTSDGTALAGTDYVTTTGTLTFPVGTMTNTISVPVIGNFIQEANKTFNVALANPANAVLATLSVGVGTILNDDTAGFIVTPTTGLVTTEAGGTATFTVQLTSQPLADVTVGLSSSNPAAGTVAPAALTFNAATWNMPQTVTVTGVDAGIVGGTQSYTVVTLPATSNDPVYQGLDAADVSVNNSNTDVAPTPTPVPTATPTPTPVPTPTPLPLSMSLTIAPGSFSEAASADGSAAAHGTITLSVPSSTPVQISLTSSNTAKVKLPHPSITIPANTMSATFALVAVDDLNVNKPQNVLITATDSSSGYGAASAPVTVTDNDRPVLTLTVARDHISEGAGKNATTATVSRNTDLSVPLTITLTSSDKTAATVPTTVQLPLGIAKISFPVAAVDDTRADGPQRVTLTARAPSFVAGTADLTVTDNEAVSNKTIVGHVTLPAAAGGQGVGAATVTLRRGATILDVVTTDGGGVYRFSNLPPGTFSVTAFKVNYFFTPASRTVTLTASGASPNSINFTGTSRISISGRLTTTLADGTLASASGITVVARNGATSVVTHADSTGHYTLDGLTLGTYTVLPTARIEFSPALRQVTLTPTLPVVVGMDFTGANNATTSNAAPSVTPTSSLALSTAAAQVATQSLQLRFTGGLDSDAASDAAHYRVTINGHAVAVDSAGYNTVTHSVTLSLPTASLRGGDVVVAQWSNLQDAQGKLVAGQTGALVAK